MGGTGLEPALLPAAGLAALIRDTYPRNVGSRKRIGVSVLLLAVGLSGTWAVNALTATNPPRGVIRHASCRWDGRRVVVTAEVANVGSSTAVFRVKPTFWLQGLLLRRGRNYVNAFTLAPGQSKLWAYADQSLRKGLAGTPIVRCAPFLDAHVVSQGEDD